MQRGVSRRLATCKIGSVKRPFAKHSGNTREDTSDDEMWGVVRSERASQLAVSSTVSVAGISLAVLRIDPHVARFPDRHMR